MSIFKPNYIDLKDDENMISKRLLSIIKCPKNPVLFKGRILQKQFSLTSTLVPNNFRIQGSIHKVSEKRFWIKLEGKLIWYRLFVNLLLFGMLVFFLFGLSILLMRENFLEGIFSVFISTGMTYLLYHHLVGRIQRNFQLQCEVIRTLLSGSPLSLKELKQRKKSS